eukprot:4358220-Prymnesium_polylepis.1
MSTAIVGAQHALAEQLETRRGELRQLQEAAATSRAKRIAEVRSHHTALEEADDACTAASGYNDLAAKLETAKERYEMEVYPAYSRVYGEYPVYRYPDGHAELTKAAQALDTCCSRPLCGAAAVF